MPNVMAALSPNIGGAFCSMLQSLADAHYQSALQQPRRQWGGRGLPPVGHFAPPQWRSRTRIFLCPALDSNQDTTTYRAL